MEGRETQPQSISRGFVRALDVPKGGVSSEEEASLDKMVELNGTESPSHLWNTAKSTI